MSLSDERDLAFFNQYVVAGKAEKLAMVPKFLFEQWRIAFLANPAGFAVALNEYEHTYFSAIPASLVDGNLSAVGGLSEAFSFRNPEVVVNPGVVRLAATDAVPLAYDAPMDEFIQDFKGNIFGMLMECTSVAFKIQDTVMFSCGLDKIMSSMAVGTNGEYRAVPNAEIMPDAVRIPAGTPFSLEMKITKALFDARMANYLESFCQVRAKQGVLDGFTATGATPTLPMATGTFSGYFKVRVNLNGLGMRVAR